jgi:hypothetical protein
MTKNAAIVLFFLNSFLYGKAQQIPQGYSCPSSMTLYQNGMLKVCFSDPNNYSIRFGGISYESISINGALYFHGENNAVVGEPNCQWYSPDPNNLLGVGNTVQTILINGSINNYSVKNIGDFNCLAVLPIHLLQFNATASTQHTSNVNWQTEQSGEYYWHILERSEDGINFTEIQKEKIQQTIVTKIDKSYKDHPPIDKNIFYYRLKLQAANNNITYSEIKKVVFQDKNNAIVIYPNPVNDYLQINQVQAKTGRYILYNNIGQKAKEGQLKNSASQSISTKDLQRGVYTLTIITDKGTETFKIVKI